MTFFNCSNVAIMQGPRLHKTLLDTSLPNYDCSISLSEILYKFFYLPCRRVDDLCCGLTACTVGSAPGPTLGNEHGKPVPLVYPFILTDV